MLRAQRAMDRLKSIMAVVHKDCRNYDGDQIDQNQLLCNGKEIKELMIPGDISEQDPDAALAQVKRKRQHISHNDVGKVAGYYDGDECGEDSALTHVSQKGIRSCD